MNNPINTALDRDSNAIRVTQAPGSTSAGLQGNASTSTPTNVSSSASSVTILAANTSRKGASIFNDSTQILYLLRGGNGVASTTNYSTQIPPNSLYELPAPVTTALLTGIWASANGAARVTEET